MILPAMFGESDILSHVPDDVIISAMAIGIIVIIVASWKSFALRSHRKGRQWVKAFWVIALLGQIVGFVFEYSDPNDVGNEYIGLILIAIGLVVAFV
jgi:uncharacterized membrane protein YfcA